MGARGLAAWLAVAVVSSTLSAQKLPAFSGQDLLGRPHHSRELQGRPTLVVAITDRVASDAMAAWLRQAERVSPQVHLQAVISLELPFWVSERQVRDRVRQRAPREHWSATWVDRDGAMAAQLGLARSRTPFVFVLDRAGRVVARFQGGLDEEGAAEIWRALKEVGSGRSASEDGPSGETVATRRPRPVGR